MAPVLTLENRQQTLYLYIPTVFVANFFSCVSAVVAKRLVYKTALVNAVLCIALLCSTYYFPNVRQFREWWISESGLYRSQAHQIIQLGDLPSGCHVYISGAKENFNILNPYGPGNFLKFIYKDLTLDIQLVDKFPETPEAPYVFWTYEEEKFKELERNVVQNIPVSQIYLKPISQNKLIVAVTYADITDEFQLWINGEPCETAIGADFISTEYPGTIVPGEK